jgi:hypothetical protein
VNDKPALREHQLTFDVLDTGETFNFILQVYNVIGLADSVVFSYVLAAVPDMPTQVPALNLEFTSAKQIHVDYPALLVSENGGSPILSYELSLYNTTT